MFKKSIQKNDYIRIIPSIVIPVMILCSLMYLLFVYHPYENNFNAVSERVNDVFSLILIDYQDKEDIPIIHEILSDTNFMRYRIVPKFYDMAKYLSIFDFIMIRISGLSSYQENQVRQIAKEMQTEIERRKTLK